MTVVAQAVINAVDNASAQIKLQLDDESLVVVDICLLCGLVLLGSGI
jgi:hypothetical protein